MNRREFLRSAGGAAGATAAVAAAGPAVAQQGNETDDGTPMGTPGNATEGTPAGTEAPDGGGGGGDAPEPDFGGYLDDVPNFDEVVDARGQDAPEVTVGGEANSNWSFEPAAIHIAAGTKLTWVWSGEGGAHNVIHEDGDFESDLTGEEGFEFTHTFEEDGIYEYYCQPHKGQGMKGAIVVGEDYPAVESGGGGGGATEIDPKHMGVPFQPHFVGIATIVAIFVSLVFTFFHLKYGESGHTKGGNE